MNGAFLKAKVGTLRVGFTALNNELAQEGPNEYLLLFFSFHSLSLLPLFLLLFFSSFFFFFFLTIEIQIFMDKVSAFLATAKPKVEEVESLSIAMDKAYPLFYSLFISSIHLSTPPSPHFPHLL